MSNMLLQTESIEPSPVSDYAHHAKAWESSGMNQRAYCKRHGLSYQKLVFARSKLLTSRGQSRTQKPKASFVPVRANNKAEPPISNIQSKDSQSSPVIKITSSNGTVIEIPTMLSNSQLSAICHGLEKIL